MLCRSSLIESASRSKLQRPEIDIIVHRIDDQLTLYRCIVQICTLECQNIGKNCLFSIHQCLPDVIFIFLRQHAKPSVIAYYSHPFNYISSILLRNVFSIHSYYIQRVKALKFQAEIIYSKIQVTKESEDTILDVDLKDLDWIIFQKKMLYSAQNINLRNLDSYMDAN